MKIKKAVKKLFKHFSLPIADAKGFTLIEIGIVLAIVGIIIAGAIIKATAINCQRKNKNLVKQYQSLTAAIYGYQENIITYQVMTC